MVGLRGERLILVRIGLIKLLESFSSGSKCKGFIDPEFFFLVRVVKQVYDPLVLGLFNFSTPPNTEVHVRASTHVLELNASILVLVDRLVLTDSLLASLGDCLAYAGSLYSHSHGLRRCSNYLN